MTLDKFRYIDISKYRRYLYIDLNKYFVFGKRDIAIALFTIGIAINIFASIHVMYFWMIEAYCPFVTMPLFSGSAQRIAFACHFVPGAIFFLG